MGVAGSRLAPSSLSLLRGKKGVSEVHTMPTDQRHELQRDRLVALVERLRNLDSEYWRAKLSDVDPSRMAAADMTALPFTTKAEMRDHRPRRGYGVQRRQGRSTRVR